MVEESEYSIAQWIEWGQETYGPGEPQWTKDQWTGWARDQRAAAGKARGESRSKGATEEFASPDKYMAMKESADAEGAAALSPTASEKALLEAVASEEQALMKVAIG